ncbi:MAG: hypothetical protein P4L91_04195 [Burkholderiaceae bacterium]|nr:hypothetical protein [Burkholderiaceae bacterium]
MINVDRVGRKSAHSTRLYSRPWRQFGHLYVMLCEIEVNLPMQNYNPYEPPKIKSDVVSPVNRAIGKNLGFKFTIGLSFVWLVVLPFVWAFNFSKRFDLSYYLAFLSYRPELICVIPSAILLVATWKFRKWAVSGLFVGAFLLPIMKISLGGFPSNSSWIVGSFLFFSLSLRLRFLLKLNA